MTMKSREVLFTARTTNGNSSTMELLAGYRDYTMLITGVVDTATITLQGSIDNSTFATLSAATTGTALGQINFATSIPYLRVAITGVGALTLLNIAIFS